MRATFYEKFGRFVLAALIGYLRFKNGRLLLPRKVLLAGAGALALGIAVAGARRNGGSGQLRP